MARAARARQKTVTIQDVARRAGVSPMTVSRVINNEISVRETTRTAVRAAIDALNYAPNPAARTLAGKGLIRIGLLYSNPSSAYLSEFLLGGLEAARTGDVQLVVEKCDEGGEARAAAHLASQDVHGVVLPPPLCELAQVIDPLAEAGVPVAAVAGGAPAPGVSCVRIDNRRAAREMTEHLLGLGHRRIGFIAGHPSQSASAERRDGYLDALRSFHAPIESGLVAQGLFTHRSGLEAAETLLSLAEAPTAIFAANDDMAAGALAAAHRRGLHVPADLSLCGFDDSSIATSVWPELTTIHQPIADMAARAVELLRDQIRASRAGRGAVGLQETLPFRLVRRESDGPPPGG
jgi:LacI family transcriptional regulator